MGRCACDEVVRLAEAEGRAAKRSQEPARTRRAGARAEKSADLRKEDRQFALQSSRREKCDSFKLDDTLQRKAHTRLPLFVFPTRSLSQPLTEHGERFSYAFKS